MTYEGTALSDNAGTGWDRRTLKDRRWGVRRYSKLPVPFERRTEDERRTVFDRRRDLAEADAPAPSSRIAAEPSTSQCRRCKHFWPDVFTANLCDAFPTGIPFSVMTTQRDHRAPIPGDRGIRFQAVDGLKHPLEGQTGK